MYYKLHLETNDYGNRQSEIRLSIFTYLIKWQLIGKISVHQSNSIVALRNKTEFILQDYNFERKVCVIAGTRTTDVQFSVLAP